MKLLIEFWIKSSVSERVEFHNGEEWSSASSD